MNALFIYYSVLTGQYTMLTFYDSFTLIMSRQFLEATDFLLNVLKAYRQQLFFRG